MPEGSRGKKAEGSQWTKLGTPVGHAKKGSWTYDKKEQ